MNGWQGALNILTKTHEEATEVTSFFGSKGNTLPETNMGPENGWLEYVGILLSYWGPAVFQGLC